MKKYLIFSFLFFSLLGTGVKFIYDSMDALKKEILDLKASNKALINKQTDIKKKTVERRKALITKKLNRAKVKLAKAPASMVPFLGAATVIGFTTYEIRELCNDIKDYKNFEESMFGEKVSEILEEEKLLCGLNVEDELLPELEKYKDSSFKWFENNYDIFSKEVSGYIEDLKK